MILAGLALVILIYLLGAYVVEDFFKEWWRGEHEKNHVDTDLMSLLWPFTLPCYLIWCMIGAVGSLLPCSFGGSPFKVGGALATSLKRLKRGEDDEG